MLESKVEAHLVKRVKALGVTSGRRDPNLPDVPTATEAGMPELSAPTWQALVAPPRTPRRTTTSVVSKRGRRSK